MTQPNVHGPTDEVGTPVILPAYQPPSGTYPGSLRTPSLAFKDAGVEEVPKPASEAPPVKEVADPPVEVAPELKVVRVRTFRQLQQEEHDRREAVERAAQREKERIALLDTQAFLTRDIAERLYIAEQSSWYGFDAITYESGENSALRVLAAVWKKIVLPVLVALFALTAIGVLLRLLLQGAEASEQAQQLLYAYSFIAPVIFVFCILIVVFRVGLSSAPFGALSTTHTVRVIQYPVVQRAKKQQKRVGTVIIASDSRVAYVLGDADVELGEMHKHLKSIDQLSLHDAQAIRSFLYYS